MVSDADDASRTATRAVVRRLTLGLAGLLVAGAALFAFPSVLHRGDGCRLQPSGVAGCGVLFGIGRSASDAEGLAEAEDFIGRDYDLVYRFHGLTDTIPDDAERWVVRTGRALHVNIETRVSAAGDSTTWSDVASGRFDDSLRRQARGIASLDAPVFVTFDHEMDLPRKASRGTPSEFVAAWRHVHALFREEGADKTVWVWVASGLERGLPRVGAMWPGNAYVDWISWDVYNHACVEGTAPTTFAESLDVFGAWLRREGAAAGIDIAKPVMISETGSVTAEGPSPSRGEWYEQIPEVLRANPQIRAVTLWDHDGTCDYRFTGVSDMRDPMRQLGADPVFAELDLDG